MEDENINNSEESTVDQTAEMQRLFNAQAAMVLRLLTINFILGFAVLVLAVGCGYLWWRSPEVITWKEDKDGKTLLTVNNRSYGEVSNLTISQAKPDTPEKVFASKEIARLLYNVDQDTRINALKRALDWFPNDAAKTREAFAKVLKQYGNDPSSCLAVNLEAQQRWNAQFDIQEANPVPENPSIVRILGTQKLKRQLVSNDLETRLLSIDVEMINVGNRTDSNFMTGYEPKFITCKVLQSQTQPAESGQTQLSSINSNISDTTKTQNEVR